MDLRWPLIAMVTRLWRHSLSAVVWNGYHTPEIIMLHTNPYFKKKSQTQPNRNHLVVCYEWFDCDAPPWWVLPYKDSTGVCRAKAPHFSALTDPKDSTFSTWAAPKDPLFKNIQFFVPLFLPGQIEKTFVLKNIRFFIFSSKIPCFSREGPLWKPPPLLPPYIFIEKPLPKPPILNPVRHIYTIFIFEYPPGFHRPGFPSPQDKRSKCVLRSRIAWLAVVSKSKAKIFLDLYMFYRSAPTFQALRFSISDTFKRDHRRLG